MKLALFICLTAPVAFAVLALATRKYIWNVPLTLSCAAIVALTGRGALVAPLAAGLVIAVLADYCMAHKRGQNIMYLMGISGFLLSHLSFILYALKRFEVSTPILAFAAVMLVGYGVYIAVRILPGVIGVPMKLAVIFYALVSAASLVAALGMKGAPDETLLYAAGIALIVISDTFIAEADFAGRKSVSKLILPTYFACHIFVAASAVAGI